MSADTIHIRELVGRRVAAMYSVIVRKHEGDYETIPPDRDGFVVFEDGLVVKLEGRMEVERLTLEELPAGCEPVSVTAEEHGPAWDVVDVGSDTWCESFNLLLKSNVVLGVETNLQWVYDSESREYFDYPWFAPSSVVFNRLEMPAWLHGPLPQLPALYVREWWEGPIGAYATKEEIEAQPPPSIPPPAKSGDGKMGFLRRLLGI